MKRGILLVAFGAGNARSADTLRRMQALTAERFRLPARWAFTSDTLRERLALARTKSDSVSRRCVACATSVIRMWPCSRFILFRGRNTPPCLTMFAWPRRKARCG